jgi:carbonic anhydrase/SulP family sulfate permease
LSPNEKQAFVDATARRNVMRSVRELLAQSETLAGLVRQGRMLVVGALYDVATGGIEFLTADAGTPP